MLTQPDRFDVALLHLDRPVFYQVPFGHYFLSFVVDAYTEDQSINFVLLCANKHFLDSAVDEGKIPTNWKDRIEKITTKANCSTLFIYII